MLGITWDQFGVVDNFSLSVNDTNWKLGYLSSLLSNASCYTCGSWEMFLNITDLSIAGQMYSIEIIANVSNVTSDPLTVNNSTGN